MLTLAVDTSSITESVAILMDREVLVEKTRRTLANHAETLIPSIEDALASCRVNIVDIDLFALTIGPGSFTGLRIGASTIKGLALAAEKPVIGVSTLEALAFNAAPSPAAICPFMDAKRREVYTALFSIDGTGPPERILDEQVTPPEPFISSLPQDVVFIGDGARKYSGLIKEMCPTRVAFGMPSDDFVRASNVGLLGIDLFSRGQRLELMTFTPRYLRLSHAEKKPAGQSQVGLKSIKTS